MDWPSLEAIVYAIIGASLAVLASATSPLSNGDHVRNVASALPVTNALLGAILAVLLFRA